MKKTFIFLFLLVSVQLIAQTYPISKNISLLANPDASLTKAGAGTLLIPDELHKAWLNANKKY